MSLCRIQATEEIGNRRVNLRKQEYRNASEQKRICPLFMHKKEKTEFKLTVFSVASFSFLFFSNSQAPICLFSPPLAIWGFFVVWHSTKTIKIETTRHSCSIHSLTINVHHLTICFLMNSSI